MPERSDSTPDHDTARKPQSDSLVENLPATWEPKVLDDLVDPVRPIAYGILMPGTGYPGGVPVIKVKDIASGQVNVDGLLLTSPAIDYEYRRSRVKPGDLLFTIRGTVARMATVPPELDNANITQDTARIAVKDANVSFVRQYLRMPTPQRFIGVHTLGVAVQGINLRDVRRIPIALPPKAEADKIAEILDTLDEAIRKTEQIITKLKQVKQGLLHDLLTHGIDDNGELRDPIRHPEQFKDSALGMIPRAWAAAPFRDYGASDRPYLKTGPFGSSLKQEHWVDHGVPVITIGALGEGDFIRSELLHVSEATAKDLAAYRVREGDIVFSRVADVGRSVVVRDREEGWLLSSNLMWIALDQGRASPAFVQANIAANPFVRSQIRRSVNAGGREVANASVLNSLVLPWPSVHEQIRIVDVLASEDDRLMREETELAKLRLLKQGLAEDLLTGRVRVTGERATSRRSESPQGQLGLDL